MSYADYEAVRLRRVERAEPIAQAFHESYERQAGHHGYETRPESAVPWADVPENNKALMIAVVNDLIDRRIIYTASAYANREDELREIKAALRGFKELIGA